MKQKTIYASILGVVLMATMAVAFDLVELEPYQTLADFSGDNELKVTHGITSENGEITSDFFILNFQFDGQQESSQLQVFKDGTWTMNGVGVCLEDGSSSTGGTCFRTGPLQKMKGNH